MLIVSGRIHVSDRREYLRDCVAVVEAARSSPGCLDFSLSPDLVEDDRINVYERWESDEDLERFRASGPSSDQQAEITDADVRKYRISAVEEP